MPSGYVFAHQAPPIRDEEIGDAIGHELRGARQRSGADLYDIADLLRIKPSYLYALENGDYDAIPGMPYVLGFLRSYADHLGLDGQKLARRLKSGEPAVSKPLPSAYRVAPRQESRPYALVVLATLVLASAGYGAWTYLSGQLEPAANLIAEAPLDPPWAEQPNSVVATIGSPASPSALPPALSATPPPPQAMASAQPAEVAAVAEPSLEVAAATAHADAQGPATNDPALLASTNAAAVPPAVVDEGRPNPGVGAAVASEARVVLIATEPAWIQVRSTDRQFSRSRLMEQGEHFPLPERTDLALWTGNAGGLQVMVDGTELAPLGPRGAVLKNIPLDPAGLKARFAPQ